MDIPTAVDKALTRIIIQYLAMREYIIKKRVTKLQKIARDNVCRFLAAKENNMDSEGMDNLMEEVAKSEEALLTYYLTDLAKFQIKCLSLIEDGDSKENIINEILDVFVLGLETFEITPTKRDIAGIKQAILAGDYGAVEDEYFDIIDTYAVKSE